MTEVYVLVHDDRYYDMGDTYVRGVYASKEQAEADLMTREPSGRPSRAYGAHTLNCCSVQTYEVLEGTHPHVMDLEVAVPQTGGDLIPPGFVDELAVSMAPKAPFGGPKKPSMDPDRA